MNKTKFDETLKESPHFRDAMGTHREATAQILSAFIRHLNQRGQIDIAETLRILLDLGRGTGQPSLDGERRIITHAIREFIQR